MRTVAALRARVREWRAAGRSVALVPTMGALHAGHLALVAAGFARADRVVASVFVNPKQFGPNEDFSRYPRREAEDAAALAGAGCNLLFAPAPEDVYPAGFATGVHVAGLTADLDGAHRPGHFDGVTTVVSKLLNQAQADFAMFGEKDYQQLLTVRRMAADLDIATQIVGVPTVREADGLALSSRNAYLSADERARAALFPKTLIAARDAVRAGTAVEAALAEAEAALRAAGLVPDYVALRDAETLEPVRSLERPARILSAVRLGSTRLIDNLAVETA
ncbi:pantoate--beta-alanine ligase [Sphingosinicella soli]|uniref:Pantothenate synthetase n=1 Tax=Sphingosinicella soli TaxID=333708 RepID=A0A7W7F8Q8_9SPHN|nr:pantoate--beta-alanine ligase [Sphingosinicella soli]